MAPARHSSGGERIENGSEFWNLKTCAVKKLIKVKSRHAVESRECEHVHVDLRSNGCGLKIGKCNEQRHDSAEPSKSGNHDKVLRL